MVYIKDNSERVLEAIKEVDGFKLSEKQITLDPTLRDRLKKNLIEERLDFRDSGYAETDADPIKDTVSTNISEALKYDTISLLTALRQEGLLGRVDGITEYPNGLKITWKHTMNLPRLSGQ